MASSTRVVAAGAHLPGDDPFVVSNPSYFELVDGAPVAPKAAPTAPVVEQATAAPGEKRTTVRKAKA
jgi:hypothetical protein